MDNKQLMKIQNERSAVGVTGW